MITLEPNTFFSTFGVAVPTISMKKSVSLPFKGHPLLTMIVDSLSRKQTHHVIVQADFSPSLQIHFADALFHQLKQQQLPASLQGVDLLYLNIANVLLNTNQHMAVEKEFHDLAQALNQSKQPLLIILPSLDFLAAPVTSHDDGFLRKQFNTLLSHPYCRFLVFSAEQPSHYHLPAHVYATLTIAALSENDIQNLLKIKRAELEAYHHIIIPEECLSLAYALTERYISIDQTLDKTLLLLDSSAARASMAQATETTNSKPVLTNTTLTTVLSNWTHIPAAQLTLQKFKLSDFTQFMQRNLFGQDAAINLLGQQLQQAHAKLQHHIGPFCSLLLAGPAHTGKNTAIVQLANYLFKQTGALFFAEPPGKALQSVGDIKVRCYQDNRTLSLKQLIHEMPYAMIVFDHIEDAPMVLLDGLNEIISTGCLHEVDGTTHHFQQSTLIFTTTCVASDLIAIANTLKTPETAPAMDLLQLVMNEQHQPISTPQESPDVIATTVMTALTEHLPKTFCQYVNCIPFLPLNRAGVEKIVRMKLKELGLSLQTRYGVELGYAPEVIRYLSTDILQSECDKSLRQLYFVVEQAALNHSDNKHRSNQLFLQLNETGQVLRCDWLAASAIKQHAT